jgi:hypothetical protein
MFKGLNRDRRQRDTKLSGYLKVRMYLGLGCSVILEKMQLENDVFVEP